MTKQTCEPCKGEGTIQTKAWAEFFEAHPQHKETPVEPYQIELWMKEKGYLIEYNMLDTNPPQKRFALPFGDVVTCGSCKGRRVVQIESSTN